MYDISYDQIAADIKANVEAALTEDIGTGDITAQLIPADHTGSANIITREEAVICGTAWVNETFRLFAPDVKIDWLVSDGEQVNPNQTLLHLSGSSRALLTCERTALNFLQFLSGIATRCHYYKGLVSHTNVQLLDTRKTLPGLRVAEKFAVVCGGCHNHRIGLFDAFLIKENHIAACGNIENAVARAREMAPGKPVEVEVETLNELHQALAAGAEMIMLDNLSLDDIRAAVEITAGRAKLEASGGVTETTLVSIAETGVDYISLGTLTKDVKAIDLSMRITI